MAAPKCIKDYIGKTLLLPHLFWGEAEARGSYPNDWGKGHAEVTLLENRPATRKEVERLTFKADDGQTYVIPEDLLKQYWNEKRFLGHLYTMYYTYVMRFVLLSIYIIIFCLMQLCVVFLDQRAPKRRVTKNKKSVQTTNEGCNVVV